MRRATYFIISFSQGRRHFHRFTGGLIKPSLLRVEFQIGETLAIDNIELRPRRLAFRIGIIAFSGSRQCTTLMPMLRPTNLSRNLFALRVVAQHFTGMGFTALGIAGLNHEISYDAMKQHPVIKSGTHKFQKIVTVQRGVIIKFHPDIAHRRGQQHFMANCVGCRLGTSR